MKITKKILERIIQEEMKSILLEAPLDNYDIKAINRKLAIGMKAIKEAMAMLHAAQQPKKPARDTSGDAIDLNLFEP